MQEAPPVGSVGWDPISVNYHLPWASKLLILYLLVVAVISLVKSAGIVRLLWSLSPDSARAPRVETEFVYTWETCSNKIQSIKRLVFTTILLIVLITTLLLRASLLHVVQKDFGLAALSGSIVEVLTVFAIGVLACAVIYAACALCEGTLSRRRTSWNRSAANTVDRLPKG